MSSMLSRASAVWSCLSVTGIILELELNLSLSSSRRRAGLQRLLWAEVHQGFCSLWISGWFFFPFLTGHFYVLITVGTAVFLQSPTASRQKLLWLLVLLAGLLFSLLFAGTSWDTEWLSWPSLSVSCSLHTSSCASVVSHNGLDSKLESSVLQMALSLIRKSLMSVESHVGARVCSYIM